MKKEKLVWRLGKLPTVEEIQNLVKDKIITQEEARNILFSSQTEEDRDKESLENEIKFLKELVDRLSSRTTATIVPQIIETIRYFEKPYERQPWFQPYVTWCDSSNQLLSTGIATNAIEEFSNIKTF